MPIQVEIWARDLAANIYPTNTFIVRSKDDGMYSDGRKVHLPQSGTNPGVAINRSVFPAGATERTDITLEYSLDAYSTDPTHLKDVDEVEVSYDKRQSIITDHSDTLNTVISDWMLVKWSPTAASRIVRTTGDGRPAGAPSATNNRKKVTLADFLKAKRILDKDDVPSEGRVVVIPADMYNDLLELDAIISADKLGNAALPSGVVGRIFGFDIYIRSKVLIYNNNATPLVKDPTVAAAATDNEAALFYHPNFVRRALGTVKPFFKENDPQYYGDVFSAEVRAGGSKARTDNKGVVVLVEDAAP